MTSRIYIDGQTGTTGLRIRELLQHRDDLNVLVISEKHRKDAEARRDYMLNSDISIFCLPDDAAKEAAAWLEGSDTRIIDASTAHRVAPDWVFGLAELQASQPNAIRNAKRVSNPGCYSSAFILLVRPLVEAGILAATSPLTIHALSGYSGGGKKMIARYDQPDSTLKQLPFENPYALARVHKHIPEMMRYTTLVTEPYFVPAVGAFRCGMRVQVPVPAQLLTVDDLEQVHICLTEYYAKSLFVNVLPLAVSEEVDQSLYDPRSCNDTNRLDIRVMLHPSGHVLLMAILDNLGKGAGGMAVQNLNLMLGVDEVKGLIC
ncbi:MAG: N-acetyl-gamma-glutamyl-phosphate reductase [Deinococcota bacterium]